MAHLDGHLAALQRRPVDLRDRSRGERLLVKGFEALAQRHAQRRLDLPLGVREVVHGRVGVELGKLGAESLRKHVRPARRPLPPLDEGGPGAREAALYKPEPDLGAEWLDEERDWRGEPYRQKYEEEGEASRDQRTGAGRRLLHEHRFLACAQHVTQRRWAAAVSGLARQREAHAGREHEPGPVVRQ